MRSQPEAPHRVLRRRRRRFLPDLSHSPLLGILGVLLGAAIVSIAGRLLTLGLADLKGNVGIGFDEGAWIGSAFNVALMFIGPFSVYLGALLGPRRVLLVCASVFTAVCAFLPLVHSYSLLIFLLAIAGLASGTFYPLTLTFALRSIPLRYLALVIALYVTCIEGAVILRHPSTVSSAITFPGNGCSGFRHCYPVDDGVYLFRDSPITETAEQEGTTELYWIPLSQCRLCAALRRIRSGTETRLVAIGFV